MFDSELALRVYEDFLSPSVKDLSEVARIPSKALKLIFKPINMTLDQKLKHYEEFSCEILSAVERKGIDLNNIVEPNSSIVGPSFEAFFYSELRRQYANLIASSIDRDLSKIVHPSFAEMLKHLSPSEAHLLQIFPLSPNSGLPMMDLGYKSSALATNYIFRNFYTFFESAGLPEETIYRPFISNLCRLGLVIIHENEKLLHDSEYQTMRRHDLFHKIIKEIPKGCSEDIRCKYISLTGLGVDFVKCCVHDCKAVVDQDAMESVVRSTGPVWL